MTTCKYQLVLAAILVLMGSTWGQHKQRQTHQTTTYHGFNGGGGAAPQSRDGRYDHGGGVSRQYAHFSGPVSGAEHEVVVARSPAHAHLHAAPSHHYQHGQQAHHGAATALDYVAKPDYKFAYGVEDSKTGNKQTHQETRDGDVVRGQYSLVEPDGSLRIVEYTADSTHGFQAVVKRQGHAPEVFGGAAPAGPQQHQEEEHEDDEEAEDEDYD